MQRKVWIVIALVSLGVYLLLFLFNSNFLASLREGQLAPEFSLIDMQGDEHRLQDYRGKVVLLNFWATWCGPCRHEMPSLEALYRKYQERGFVILAISLDENGLSDLNPFLKKLPLTFPVLLDQDFQIANLYGNTRIPESVLIDKKGKIVSLIHGPQKWDQKKFWDQLEVLLNL